MTQLAPVAACALTAPEMASAASSASVYLSCPSLERFDGVTIALRCTLSDTSRVGSGGVESTICATCRLAARGSVRHAPAQGSHQGWTWLSLGKAGGRDVCSRGRRCET